jgi:hypothetical protein
VKVSDTDSMWKLNREIFPGDVQQRDAKLEYELMLVQHWLFNKRMTIITIQTTEAMNVMSCE